ncbi:hypothetical protein [Serratia proteamaculans]|uniref:hypothetical protein n=1 Tax=Serratia proteamaculans TaxID=28151 RepID=UPI000A1564CA|nr:hypothetical protein [Serratia proteamaculans]
MLDINLPVTLESLPMIGFVILKRLKMKKIIAVVLLTVSFIIGVYALIDVIRSAYYVLVYESLTGSSIGVIFGKTLFFIVMVAIFLFACKFYKKN